MKNKTFSNQDLLQVCETTLQDIYVSGWQNTDFTQLSSLFYALTDRLNEKYVQMVAKALGTQDRQTIIDHLVGQLYLILRNNFSKIYQAKNPLGYFWVCLRNSCTLLLQAHEVAVENEKLEANLVLNNNEANLFVSDFTKSRFVSNEEEQRVEKAYTRLAGLISFYGGDGEYALEVFDAVKAIMSTHNNPRSAIRLLRLSCHSNKQIQHLNVCPDIATACFCLFVGEKNKPKSSALFYSYSMQKFTDAHRKLAKQFVILSAQGGELERE